MRKVSSSSRLYRLCGIVLTAAFIVGCSGGKHADGATAAATGADENTPPASAPPASTPPPSSPPASAPPPVVALQGVPPDSVTVGDGYLFQPSVQSSAAVTFAIDGLPPWATFNSSTGKLTGTPGSEDMGLSGYITISASIAGGATTSLAPFTIEVIAAAPSAGNGAVGSIHLSWEAPTKNTDGTPITDLAGYHIYYGTSAGQLTNTIEIFGTSTTYVIGALPAGTYYFSVLAFNSAGLDSGLSTVASETI